MLQFEASPEKADLIHTVAHLAMVFSYYRKQEL